MYPQRTVNPFQLGFPQIPQAQRNAFTPTGMVATGPGPQQQQQPSALSGLAPTIGSLALRKALTSAPAPLFGGAEAGAAADAADAASPYASSALLANGADPEIMAQLAAEGTTADLGLGAGAAAGTGAAAGSGAAAAAGSAAAADAGAAAGAESAGLLGMGALGPIALGGLGIYGLGSLLDWW